MRPLLIFCVVLAAYVLTAGGHLYSPDEEIMFRTTRSLATRASLAIEKIDPTGFGTSPADPKKPDGPQYAQYGIGQPILAVPFYWAGAAVAGRAPESFWKRVSPNPFNEADGQAAQRWACSWFNIVLGAFMAVLLFLVCFELTGNRDAATWAALLYALGSLAWPHTRPFFSESCATFFVLLSFYGLLKGIPGARASSPAKPHECGMRNAECGMDEKSAISNQQSAISNLQSVICNQQSAIKNPQLFWCFIAGAAAGYAALVRTDAVLAYPALAILLLAPFFRRESGTGETETVPSEARGLSPIPPSPIPPSPISRSPFTPIIAFCIPALICGFILLGLNWLHYGGPLKTGYQDQPEGVAFSTPLLAGLYGFLFSAGKGLFFFSPALALGFLGWRHLARHGKALTWAVALAILIPLFLHAKWQNWPGGWCWGPRHIFMIHPFLAIPIAAWMAAAAGKAARVAAGVMLAVGAAVQLLGASQDFMLFHNRFFRSPGDMGAFYVIYDQFDQDYWSRYFQLQYRDAPGEQPRPLPMLVPPRPIQDSIYIPQASVWTGYPQMLREGYLDNFWVRFAHARKLDHRSRSQLTTRNSQRTYSQLTTRNSQPRIES